jgi:hypothetical protein
MRPLGGIRSASWPEGRRWEAQGRVWTTPLWTTRCGLIPRERLVTVTRENPRFGYRRLHVLLGREGEQVNHKGAHRIYREAGLALRRKKRKHCVRLSKPLGAA